DLNATPFESLVANVATVPHDYLNTLRRYKGYTSIAYRLSDATSTYNGLQLYVVKRKGDLELTAAYTWSRTLTDTSGNGDGLDVGEDPFNRHYNYGPASFDRRHIFVTTYDYHIPFLRGKKGVEGALLSGWEVSGITRFQSGAYFTPTGSTAIGTRRADYIGGPVLLSKPGPDGWINPAVFAPAPLGRRGNAPVGIVQGPNLQTWDFSMRKQFRLTERFNLRFQADRLQREESKIIWSRDHMRPVLVCIFLLALLACVQAQQIDLIANPDGRKTVSLDGEWKTIIDPYESGYFDYRYQPSANGYFKD